MFFAAVKIFGWGPLAPKGVPMPFGTRLTPNRTYALRYHNSTHASATLPRVATTHSLNTSFAPSVVFSFDGSDRFKCHTCNLEFPFGLLDRHSRSHRVLCVEIAVGNPSPRPPVPSRSPGHFRAQNDQRRVQAPKLKVEVPQGSQNREEAREGGPPGSQP